MLEIVDVRNTITESSSKKVRWKNVVVMILGVLLGFFFLSFFWYVANTFFSRGSKSIVPFPVFSQPTGFHTNSQVHTQQFYPTGVDAVPNNICSQQYAGYPSYKAIYSSRVAEIGAYTGRVTAIDTARQTITLLSIRDTTQFTFSLHSILEKLFTFPAGKPIQLTSIHSGAIATILFSCLQDPGKFVLTEVQVK